MATIDLIPPDPAHTPPGASEGDVRALLYPLWVVAVEIRPYPRAAPRAILFSVDGVRGVPLPIKGEPPTDRQEVPENVRLVPAISEAHAVDTTRHFVKKGLGWLGGIVGRVNVVSIRKVWKLFWLTESAKGPALIDSRAGTVLPMPDDLPIEG